MGYSAPTTHSSSRWRRAGQIATGAAAVIGGFAAAAFVVRSLGSSAEPDSRFYRLSRWVRWARRAARAELGL